MISQACKTTNKTLTSILLGIAYSVLKTGTLRKLYCTACGTHFGLSVTECHTDKDCEKVNKIVFK